MPDRQNSGNDATRGVKRFLCAAGMALLLLPAAALAKDAGSSGVSGSVTPGVQSVNQNTDSSKFNEYRDIQNGGILTSFDLDALNTRLGRYFELRGTNLFRDDQNILASMGRRGRWDLEIEWDEIPHRLSNKARTPFTESTGGLFTVPATVSQVSPGMLKELAPATSGGLTGGQKQQANDLLTEAWLDTYLHSVGLGNDRQKGTASLDYALRDNLTLQFDYSRENRDGNKVTYGTIGDRPPRSLNIQFTEPIDYQTQELKFDTDYSGNKYQVDFAYLVSNFENSNDTLTWQNIYTDPAAGTFEAWGGATPRNVATYGQRPLPQDNRFQNLSLSFGLDLPMASRLSGSAAYSVAKQDETLIPYSTNSTLDAVAAGDGLAWNDPAKLPRRTADAEVKTRLLNLDYTVNPVKRFNLKAFFRMYDLSNNTPTDEWRYVTQDTTGTTGSVSYLNMRRNLAYEYDKKNFGLDTTYNLALWTTALSLGFEREEIDREFREADTDENILRVSVRSRPTSWFNFRIKYLFGNRDADAYDGEAAHESYWYAPADANDNIDSQFTFENHPDSRRYDVTDRERKQFDLLATLVPNDVFDLSASYRYRKDDYDSNVTPTQPLLNYDGGRATITAADRASFSPGDQVGLLKDERKFYGLDISYTPTQRLRVSAYTNREHLWSGRRFHGHPRQARCQHRPQLHGRQG